LFLDFYTIKISKTTLGYKKKDFFWEEKENQDEKIVMFSIGKGKKD
jgi:hypothetical protein